MRTDPHALITQTLVSRCSLGAVLIAALCHAGCAASKSVGSDDASGASGGTGGLAGGAGGMAGGAGGFPQQPPFVKVLDAHPVLKDGSAEVFIVLSHTWTDIVSVEFETHDATAIGDATGNGDFKPVKKIVSVLPGSLKASVLIDVNTPYKTITMDTALSRFFKTQIANPTSGATIADGDGVVTLAAAGMVIETPLASGMADGDLVPDFEGDKSVDLLLSGRAGKACLLLSTGTVFDEAQHAIVDDAYLDGSKGFSWLVSNYGSSAIHVVGDQSAAADVNGDGLSDVLVVGEKKAHFLYGHAAPIVSFISADPRLSNGVDGTHLQDLYFGEGAAQIQTGDWNNDGVFDWAQASSYSTIAGGADRLAGFYGEAGQYGATHTSQTSFSFKSGATPVGVASKSSGAVAGGRGDLNGDGFEDMFFGGIAANDGQFGGNYLYVRFGDQSKLSQQGMTIHGTLTGKDGFEVSDANYFSHLTGYAVQDSGDLNGDGIDDMVLTGGGNPLTVIFGKKAPFAKGVYASLADLGAEAAFFNTDKVKSARIGDLNRDGLGDIVFITENKLRVVWGQKDLKGKDIFGTKYPEVGEIDIDPASGLDNVAAIGDIDGDKTDDVVILTSTWGAGGGAVVLFGKTITRTLGGPALDPQIPR
jgi:hypothetical protein